MSLAVPAAALAAGIGGAALLDLLADRRRLRRARERAAVLRGAALLAGLGRRAGVRQSADLAERLQAAGVAISPADFAAIQAGGVMIALVALGPIALAAPARSGAAVLVGGVAAVRAAPRAWLRRRTRLRARAIEAELADVLDLLRVATAAGLAPMRALGEVGRRHPGVLAGELHRAAARRGLGVPAAGAIAELELRCPGEGVGALCSALRRADRHGAPLAAALAAQARDARARQAARIADGAARAAPQIQLVVALVLVPAVLLLVAAGLLPALAGR
jgi:tight adherence protein C